MGGYIAEVLSFLLAMVDVRIEEREGKSVIDRGDLSTKHGHISHSAHNPDSECAEILARHRISCQVQFEARGIRVVAQEERLNE